MRQQSIEAEQTEALRRLLAITEQQLKHAEDGDLQALEQLSGVWEQVSAEIGDPPPLQAAATLQRALLLGERTQERLLVQRERLQKDLLRLRELSRAAHGYSAGAGAASSSSYDRTA